MIGADAVISVVVPVHNDGAWLEPAVAETLDVLSRTYRNYELILVDDCSSAETLLRLEGLLRKHESLRLIQLSRRYGTEVSMMAGLESSVGDYVVVMRLGCDAPAEIPAMVEAASLHDGLVLGTSTEKASSPWLFRSCRAMFYWLLSVVLRMDVPSSTTGFCALSRRVVNAISRIKSKHRHLRVLSCVAGFPVALHHYHPRPGMRPESRSLAHGLSDAIAIVVSNSKAPLRIVTSMGIAAAVINLCYVGYVIAVYLFKNDVAPGWVTLSLQNAVMFLFVFSNLVLISEYVAQILDESQDRPLYHVLDERASAFGSDKRLARRNVLALYEGDENQGGQRAAV